MNTWYSYIEGLKNEKAKGIKFGRPNRKLPENFKKSTLIM